MKTLPTTTPAPLISVENRQPSVWLDRLKRWHRDQQTRLHLADLPPHMLRDIGLSETDRDHETKKWFWQG
jgi:uncharacterized protein YjiS (DUF1127 family)